MAYSWYSKLFRDLIARFSTFERIVADNFGPTEPVLFVAKGGTTPIDVRTLLRPLGQTELMLKGVLSGIVKENDALDVKVGKIRDAVNSRLTYVGDQQNYMMADYWADPWTVWDKKKDDCDGYAVLIMALMKLAGVPEWRRRIVVGTVATGEAHAYVAYLTEENNLWCAVEGSYYAEDAKAKFNDLGINHNFRYVDVWFTFTETQAWRCTNKVFLNTIIGGK